MCIFVNVVEEKKKLLVVTFCNKIFVCLDCQKFGVMWEKFF